MTQKIDQAIVVHQTECMICGSKRLAKFLDLGLQPNGNEFPDEATKHEEIKYPLSMSVCEECWLVQLDAYPPPEVVFTNHPYVSGLNVPIVEHFQRAAKHIVNKFQLPQHSLIVDIGANDGSLLNAFRDLGMRTLGVDPGQRTGKLARARGITVCETFWNQATGKALRTLNLAPNVITGTAVFYHTPNLHEFVNGLAEVMNDHTIFVTQCVYLKNVIEELQFDHFYHEHTCIHSLKPLQQLFAQHGMRLLDVEFWNVHGGSFILYVARDSSPLPTSHTIRAAIEAEARAGLFRLETYTGFAQNVKRNCDDLATLLKSLKAEKKSVYALGAPVKGSTLMNYSGIGPDLVSKVIELNQFKIGRLTPGNHIPIVSEQEITKPPDYYLVLAWNFLDYFVRKEEKFLKAGGKFIVPHPRVQIVDMTGAKPWRPNA